MSEQFFLHNKSGAIPAYMRDAVKKKFLIALSETNRVGYASRAAGITRQTAWDWRNSGYISDQELRECREVYEEILESGIENGHFGRRSKDPFDHASGRRLLALAKAVLPEYGGRARYTVQYSTQGWTPQERAEIYNRIREIQAKHR